MALAGYTATAAWLISLASLMEIHSNIGVQTGYQVTCHPLLSGCRLSGNGIIEVQALLPRPAMAYLRHHRIQV